MRHFAIVIFCMIFGLEGSALSQGVPDGYPFDTPSDPRSLAMGKSIVAIPSNPAGLMYNPAGLAGLTGLQVSYDQRSLRLLNYGTLRSFSAVVGTSFGVFAARYDRDSYDVIETRSAFETFPDTHPYDYDIAVGYALPLGRGFSIGAGAKYYDDGGYVPVLGNYLLSSTIPTKLFDVGLMYTFRRFHSQAVVEDSITIGMSYQNIGSSPGRDFYPGTHSLNLIPTAIPQYFLSGVAYSLRVVPQNPGEPAPLSVIITGEHQGLLESGGEWGFGLEITIHEIFSVRMGGNTGFIENDSRLRAGIAIRLPLRKFGFDLSLQVAGVPLQSLSAVSIDVQIPGVSL